MFQGHPPALTAGCSQLLAIQNADDVNQKSMTQVSKTNLLGSYFMGGVPKHQYARSNWDINHAICN